MNKRVQIFYDCIEIFLRRRGAAAWRKLKSEFSRGRVEKSGRRERKRKKSPHRQNPYRCTYVNMPGVRGEYKFVSFAADARLGESRVFGGKLRRYSRWIYILTINVERADTALPRTIRDKLSIIALRVLTRHTRLFRPWYIVSLIYSIILIYPWYIV